MFRTVKHYLLIRIVKKKMNNNTHMMFKVSINMLVCIIVQCVFDEHNMYLIDQYIFENYKYNLPLILLIKIEMQIILFEYIINESSVEIYNNNSLYCLFMLPYLMWHYVIEIYN